MWSTKLQRSLTMNKKKYWYHQTTTECVLCGATEIDKERRYDKKPKKSERYNYKQEACSHHFV